MSSRSTLRSARITSLTTTPTTSRPTARTIQSHGRRGLSTRRPGEPGAVARSLRRIMTARMPTSSGGRRLGSGLVAHGDVGRTRALTRCRSNGSPRVEGPPARSSRRLRARALLSTGNGPRRVVSARLTIATAWTTVSAGGVTSRGLSPATPRVAAMADIVLGIFAIIAGGVMLFAGRYFLRILLPIWGFFAGFAFGAGLFAGLADERFLGSVLGWISGLVCALVFALLAYLYYAVAGGPAIGGLGFAIGSGVVSALGI